LSAFHPCFPLPLLSKQGNLPKWLVAKMRGYLVYFCGMLVHTVLFLEIY